MNITTTTDSLSVHFDANGRRVWPAYWLECVGGQWRLCRKSHLDMPDDDNVDWVDCSWTFEDPQLQRIKDLERQLAESRAEHARALEGMARLHEQYLSGGKPEHTSTQESVNKLA